MRFENVVKMGRKHTIITGYDMKIKIFDRGNRFAKQSATWNAVEWWSEVECDTSVV